MDLYFDWFCMAQLCGDMWTAIKQTFNQDPDTIVNTDKIALEIAADILGAAVDREQLGSENRVFQAFLQSDQANIARAF